jgi:hypothetical protein
MPLRSVVCDRDSGTKTMLMRSVRAVSSGSGFSTPMRAGMTGGKTSINGPARVPRAGPAPAIMRSCRSASATTLSRCCWSAALPCIARADCEATARWNSAAEMAQVIAAPITTSSRM